MPGAACPGGGFHILEAIQPVVEPLEVSCTPHKRSQCGQVVDEGVIDPDSVPGPGIRLDSARSVGPVGWPRHVTVNATENHGGLRTHFRTEFSSGPVRVEVLGR